MDAGSGARIPISQSMISIVNKTIAVPLIVGGGIRTPEKAHENCDAGADIIVVGNSIEKNQNLVAEIADSIHSFQVT